MLADRLLRFMRMTAMPQRLLARYIRTAGYVTQNGNWFYANAGGDLAAGWFYQDGTWYYLDPATHIMQVGFVDLGSGKYYLDALVL